MVTNSGGRRSMLMEEPEGSSTSSSLMKSSGGEASSSSLTAFNGVSQVNEGVSESTQGGRSYQYPLLSSRPFLTDMTGAVTSPMIQSQLAQLLMEMSSNTAKSDDYNDDSIPPHPPLNDGATKAEKEDAVESVKQSTTTNYHPPAASALSSSSSHTQPQLQEEEEDDDNKNNKNRDVTLSASSPGFGFGASNNSNSQQQPPTSQGNNSATTSNGNEDGPDEDEEHRILECMVTSMKEIADRAMDNCQFRRGPLDAVARDGSALRRVLHGRKAETVLSRAARLDPQQMEAFSSTGGSNDGLQGTCLDANSSQEETDQMIEAIVESTNLSKNTARELLLAGSAAKSSNSHTLNPRKSSRAASRKSTSTTRNAEGNVATEVNTDTLQAISESCSQIQYSNSSGTVDHTGNPTLINSQEETHSAFGRVNSTGTYSGNLAVLHGSQSTQFDIDDAEGPFVNNDIPGGNMQPSQSSFASFNSGRNTGLDGGLQYNLEEGHELSQSQRSDYRYDNFMEPEVSQHSNDLQAHIDEDGLSNINSPGENGGASQRASTLSPSVYEAASLLRIQQQRTPHGLTPNGALSASSSGERRNGYSNSPDDPTSRRRSEFTDASDAYLFDDDSNTRGSRGAQREANKKQGKKSSSSASSKRNAGRKRKTPAANTATDGGASGDDSSLNQESGGKKPPSKRGRKQKETKSANKSTSSSGDGNDSKNEDEPRKVSRYLGVSWIRATEKWRADSVVNGKLQYLGCYDTEKQAAQAVDKARVKGWDGKSKIRLNFPEEHPEVSTATPAVKQARGTSKFVGVSWDVKLKKWKARIVLDGRHERIGLYDSEEEAARAVDKSKVENWDGSTMPRLNFPEEYSLPHGKGSQAALVKTAVEHGLNIPKVRGKKNQQVVEEAARSTGNAEFPGEGTPSRGSTSKRSQRQSRKRRNAASASAADDSDEFMHDTSEF